jgi:hypothetical protein
MMACSELERIQNQYAVVEIAYEGYKEATEIFSQVREYNIRDSASIFLNRNQVHQH